MTSVDHSCCSCDRFVYSHSSSAQSVTKKEEGDVPSLNSGLTRTSSTPKKCNRITGSIAVSLVRSRKRKYLSLPGSNKEKVFAEVAEDYAQLQWECEIAREVIAHGQRRKIRSWLFDIDISHLGPPEWAGAEQAADEVWEQQSQETDERENSSEAHDSGFCSTSESEFRYKCKCQKLTERLELVLRKLSESCVRGPKCDCCSRVCTILGLDASSNIIWECQTCAVCLESQSLNLTNQIKINLCSSEEKFHSANELFVEKGNLTEGQKRKTEIKVAVSKGSYCLTADTSEQANRRPLQRLLFTLISNEELRIRDYESQVAGHHCNEPGEGLLILESNVSTRRSYILKPVQDLEKYWNGDGRGFNDQEFLRFCALNLHTFWLARYVPRIYGCLSYNDNMYCVLEDLTWGYLYPCIADIKVGRNDFTPFADAKKRQKRRLRYPNQDTIGYRICGMKVYDGGQYITYNKQWCSENTNMQALRRCFRLLFPKGKKARSSILQTIREKLQIIIQCIENQRMYNFISSSILIVYEGASDEECEKRKFKHGAGERTCTIRLIDFGNIYECTDLDENSLYGLRKLLESLHDFSLED